jgi:hypothetical protein
LADLGDLPTQGAADLICGEKYGNRQNCNFKSVASAISPHPLCSLATARRHADAGPQCNTPVCSVAHDINGQAERLKNAASVCRNCLRSFSTGSENFAAILRDSAQSSANA